MAEILISNLNNIQNTNLDFRLLWRSAMRPRAPQSITVSTANYKYLKNTGSGMNQNKMIPKMILSNHSIKYLTSKTTSPTKTQPPPSSRKRIIFNWTPMEIVITTILTPKLLLIPISNKINLPSRFKLITPIQIMNLLKRHKKNGQVLIKEKNHQQIWWKINRSRTLLSLAHLLS